MSDKIICKRFIGVTMPIINLQMGYVSTIYKVTLYIILVLSMNTNRKHYISVVVLWFMDYKINAKVKRQGIRAKYA